MDEFFFCYVLTSRYAKLSSNGSFFLFSYLSHSAPNLSHTFYSYPNYFKSSRQARIWFDYFQSEYKVSVGKVVQDLI